MKTKVAPKTTKRPGLVGFACGCGIILLAGCGPDPKVAQLESQMALMENQITNMESQILLVQKMDEATFIAGTNTEALTLSLQKSTDSLISQALIFQGEIDGLGESLTNFMMSKPGRTAYRPQTSYAAPGQMPASVAAQIRAGAEREWPNDFNMQVYEIKKQTEAWRALNP